MISLCDFYSVIITIVCGWLAYKNAQLQDKVCFFSAWYHRLYDENNLMKENKLAQSIYIKTSQHKHDFKNFTIDEGKQ